MIRSLICIQDDRFRTELLCVLRENAAFLTEEEWVFRSCSTLADSEAVLREMPELDAVCCDVTQAGYLDWACAFRKLYRRAGLLLVADRRLSPRAYLRPQIMASSLILRPCGREELREVAGEFLRSVMDAREAETARCLVLKTREGLLRLPYQSIYYVEAREKKLNVRLRGEEYDFYSSLDKVLEMLPAYFIRTHRSFVVNGKKILLVRSGEGVVELEDGFTIPLSRSCRSSVLEAFGEARL